MQTICLSYLLLLLCAWSIYCYPSKPLNERSTELAWQAWLLVDENQNKNEQDGGLKRRITPKSVFIAPNFLRENCSEGYQSDSMGRCIKMIKLDEDAHLNFLLQKLNEKFGLPSGLPDYDIQEDLPTPGPLQINLNIQEKPQEDTEVAIVVAPTNGSFKTNVYNVDQNKTSLDPLFDIFKLDKSNMETSTAKKTLTDLGYTITRFGAPEPPVSTSETPSTFPDALFFFDTTKQVSTTNTEPSVFSENLAQSLTTDVKRETTNNINRNLLSTSTEVFSSSEYEPSTSTEELEDNLANTENVTTELGEEVLTVESTSPDATNVTTTELTSDTESSSVTSESTTPINLVSSVAEQTEVSTTFGTSTLNIPTSTIEELGFSTSLIDAEETTKPYTEVPTSTQDILKILKPTEIFRITTSEQSITSEEYQEVNATNTAKPEAVVDTRLIYTSDQLTEGTKIAQSEAPVAIHFNSIRFPDVQSESPHLIRFPSDSSGSAPTPVSQTSQFQTLFHDYINTRAADLTESERHIFKTPNLNPVPPPPSLTHALYQQYSTHSHRSRDKNNEPLSSPPKWTDGVAKPIVLRFSRKHSLLNPDSYRVGGLFKGAPLDDVSYIFGFKNSQTPR